MKIDWTLTFLGIVVFQMILVFLQWLFFKRKEFLWYIVYLLTIFVYFYIYNEQQLGFTYLFYPNYHVQFIMLRSIGFITLASYVIFGRAFIDLTQLYPEMLPIVNKLLRSIWACTLFFLMASFLTNNLIYLENISFGIYALTFLFSAIMNLVLIRKKIVLNNFIIIGSIFAIVGGSIQGIFETMNIRNDKPMFLSHQFLSIGCIIEFICLNIGFLYKSKMIQDQEIAARESVIQLQQEKEEVSTRLQSIQKEYSMDLHDEIGSTLSSISIFNQLVQQSIDVDTAKIRIFSNKIGETVDEVMSITEEMIWGLKSKPEGNSLVQRLESFATTFLRSKNIQWTFQISEKIGEVVTNPVLERNLLLIIKEAMNNCNKYSEANTFNLSLQTQPLMLTLVIQDDGIGIHQGNTLGGNGINNMRHRCEKLGGTFTLESVPGKGTCIQCEIPLSTFS